MRFGTKPTRLRRRAFREPALFLFLATLAPSTTAIAASGSGMATGTFAAERLLLPSGTAGPVEVDALGGTILLSAKRPAAAARALAGRSGLCPTALSVDDGVRLACRTRRIIATPVRDHRGDALELREVRGVPWREGGDGPPRLPWDPVALGGDPCPGSSPASRGECAFARGDNEAAARHFQDALDGPGRSWAAVRLGDLAIAADRLEEAIGWWQAAGTTGRFARLAMARLCELTGKCLEGTSFAIRFDPAGLPWPLDMEMMLRGARVEAFLDRPVAAASRLLSLEPRARTAACSWAERLCRRIAIEALRAADGPGREEALALYLSLPDYHRGPLAAELARAGAEVAASLGAPVFAGNLLATVAGELEPAFVSAHLLRAAELFVAGDDPVRAAVILDYARSRLSPRELAAPRWKALVTALAARAAPPLPPQPPAIEPELDRARSLLARARGR